MKSGFNGMILSRTVLTADGRKKTADRTRSRYQAADK
jgi:hypothetical protein